MTVGPDYETGGGIIELRAGGSSNSFIYIFHEMCGFRWSNYAPIRIAFWYRYTEAATNNANIIVGITERDDDFLTTTGEPLKDGGLGPNWDEDATGLITGSNSHHMAVAEKRSGERHWRYFLQNSNEINPGVDQDLSTFNAASTTGSPIWDAAQQEGIVFLSGNSNFDKMAQSPEEVRFQTSGNFYPAKGFNRFVDYTQQPPKESQAPTAKNQIRLLADASAEAPNQSIDYYNLAEAPEWKYCELSIGRDINASTPPIRTTDSTQHLILFVHHGHNRQYFTSAESEGFQANLYPNDRRNMRAFIGLKSTDSSSEILQIDCISVAQGRPRHA